MTVGAERGEIAEVGSTVDVPGDAIDARRPLRWTGGAIAAATLMLALFNGGAVRGWIDEQPAGGMAARLRPAAERWEAATAGLRAPHATLRRWWQTARDARFGGESPGEPGAG